MGELLSDARYGTSKKCSYENNGIPVLRIPNIIGGSISLDDLKYSHLSDSERIRLRLMSGDIVVIRTNGSVSLVGRSAVFPEIKDVVAFASYLIRLGPMLPEIGYYVNKYLQSKTPRNFIERNARTSAGQHNVNLKTLNSIPIPLPSLGEQKRILNKIDELFFLAAQIERHVEGARRRVNKIEMSLLAKAFAGRLIPQDPNEVAHTPTEKESDNSTIKG